MLNNIIQSSKSKEFDLQEESLRVAKCATKE